MSATKIRVHAPIFDSLRERKALRVETNQAVHLRPRLHRLVANALLSKDDEVEFSERLEPQKLRRPSPVHLDSMLCIGLDFPLTSMQQMPTLIFDFAESCCVLCSKSTCPFSLR